MCPMSKIAKSAKSLHPSVQISNSTVQRAERPYWRGTGINLLLFWTVNELVNKTLFQVIYHPRKGLGQDTFPYRLFQFYIKMCFWTQRQICRLQAKSGIFYRPVYNHPITNIKNYKIIVVPSFSLIYFLHNYILHVGINYLEKYVLRVLSKLWYCLYILQ